MDSKELRCTLNKFQSGITLIELSLAASIIAVVAAIAIPKYQDYRYRVQVNHAIADIVEVDTAIQQYVIDNRELPNSLNDIGLGYKLDPWGNPYRYYNIQTALGVGLSRKDKSLVPINSDFDLYSIGRDGKTNYVLSAPASQDDVIRARDGQFIGLASGF